MVDFYLIMLYYYIDNKIKWLGMCLKIDRGQKTFSGEYNGFFI